MDGRFPGRCTKMLPQKMNRIFWGYNWVSKATLLYFYKYTKKHGKHTNEYTRWTRGRTKFSKRRAATLLRRTNQQDCLAASSILTSSNKTDVKQKKKDDAKISNRACGGVDIMLNISQWEVAGSNKFRPVPRTLFSFLNGLFLLFCCYFDLLFCASEQT